MPIVVLVVIAAAYIVLRHKFRKQSPQMPEKQASPFSAQIVTAYAIVCLGFGVYFLNNWHDDSNFDPYGVGVDGITKLFGYEQLLFAIITLGTAAIILFKARKASRGVWGVTFIALDWVFNDYLLCQAYSERYRTQITDCPNFNVVLFGAFMAIMQIIFALWFTRYWRSVQRAVAAPTPPAQSTDTVIGR
jgi:hypothetical protein